MKRLRALHIVLFALALLAQIMMPAAMARAASASSDSLFHFVICGDSIADAGDATPAPLHANAHDQCAVCQSGSVHALIAQLASDFARIVYPTKQDDFQPIIAPVAQTNWPSLQAPPCGPPTLV